jgi:hypothetical protein
MLKHFETSLDCHYSRVLFEEIDKYRVYDDPNRVAAMLEGKFIEIYQAVGIKRPFRSPSFSVSTDALDDEVRVAGEDMFSAMLLQGYFIPEIADCARPCYSEASNKLYYFTQYGLQIEETLIHTFPREVVHLNSSHRLFLNFKVVSNEYKEKLLAIL